MIKFSDIIMRLKEKTELKMDYQIAQLFEVQKNVLANYKTRNSIPYKKIVTICIERNLSLDYIILGKKQKYETLLEQFNQLSENEQKLFELTVTQEVLKKKILHEQQQERK